MSFSWLPPLLAEIAEAAGLDAALAMADARGGSRISLPAHPKENHWLVGAVGRDAAETICAYFRTGYGGKGGVVLDLPCSPNMDLVRRRRKIDEMIAAGVSADKIAVATGSHRTTVFRRKSKKQGATPRSDHPDLFD
ncbi:hypothetical protein SAMN04488527_101278 [Aliiroseovarius crassostreae]|uniref:Uncharacterized protein n=1 Tax=Aliiroseovarius crassostreae TaxID=154981 RepID=A0A0N8IBW9_9RHOB|nr:hypothetical protein [Aliiroseovarius crassostreae]KPN64275.1 hypothetical protein AKJ29_16715 [Aliiroseovarius crassostreae]SFU31486.1 hypothetical protein SAMN04488527_101278 [Aliiroseovarius crassostreae]